MQKTRAAAADAGLPDLKNQIYGLLVAVNMILNIWSKILDFKNTYKSTKIQNDN